MMKELDNTNIVSKQSANDYFKQIFCTYETITDYYGILDRAIIPETINAIADRTLTDYKVTKPYKTKKNNLKPNDIKRTSFHSQINALNHLLSKDNIEVNGKKSIILSLKDLCAFAYNQLTQNLDNTQQYHAMTTRNFMLPELAFYLSDRKSKSFWQIENHFNEKLSKRQLRRAIETLLDLKWIIRKGRGNFSIYRPNPFLEALINYEPKWILLCFYANLQIDFFDLLNVPLMNAKEQKIIDAKVKFLEYKGLDSYYVDVFFEGLVYIKLTSDNGNILEAYLPCNQHASNKIVGYDKKKKKPLTNPIGNIHHTIPLKWELFDVKESIEFSHKGRKSRWTKVVEKYTYVHFDNSIKLLCFDKIDTAYGKNQYRLFGKPFEELLEKVWSKKSYNCQYVEVSDFELLQKMFTLRFVDGKRRSELFDALGIHYTETKKAPYAN
jgi:hypothetical protein